MDSRELRYFVAVAEELNFGRAAERLGIAQPPLSRAIAQLERRLNIKLIARTSRHVSLTPAGEVLLRHGRHALTALAAAARQAQRAGERRLVLVTKPGGDAGLLEKLLVRYADEPDAIEVDVRICGISKQAGLLREGEADVAILHLPWDETAGFATEELLVEQAVAVLPRTHRLAGRNAVTMADLDGEQLPSWPGKQSTGGTMVQDSGQLMQLIALGKLVAVLPESVGHLLRPDLTTVPVTDGQPTTMILAWPEDSTSRALAAFVRAALEVAGRDG